MNVNEVSNNEYWPLHLLTLPISTYVTEGIAKICGFELFRHGTGFPQYFGILSAGADPSFGGNTSAEVAFDQDTIRQANASKNRFYIFKDSEAELDDEKVEIKIPIIGQLFKRTHTRLHAVLAGASLIKDIDNDIVRITLKIFLGFFNFFCPTLRFAYKKDEIHTFANEEEFNQQSKVEDPLPRFINDPDYAHLAYMTPDILPADRIGLLGLCRHATWEDAKLTFSTDPLQVLLGVIQIIIGVALTLLGVGIFL